MAISIGGLFRGRNESGDLLIKRIAKLFGYFIVKSEACDNSGFAAQVSIFVNPGSGHGQAYNVLTSPITARGNAVNDKFPTFGQVNEVDIV